MTVIRKRLFAATALLGIGAAFTGIGMTMTAQEAKSTELSDIRDAIAAAAKKGENVDDVRKALEALEKALPNVKKGETPPELVALRDAVESAARKGENVEGILKSLDALEKSLVGKTLTRPRPVPPPIDRVNPNPFPRPVFPGIQPFPIDPGIIGGVDPAEIQKAQDMMRRAIEMHLKDPESREALKLLDEAREMMLKAMAGGRGGLVPPAFPVLPLMPPDLGFGRIPDRARFGIRMERVSDLAAEQLELPVNQGIAIAAVVEGSAAEKAGFKAHDIILQFAGKPVSARPEDFSRLVNDVKAGEKIDAVVLRKAKKLEIKGIVLPEANLGFDRPVPRPPDGLQPRIPNPPLVDPAIIPPLVNPAVIPPMPPGGRDPLPGNSTSVSIVNGAFTIKATQDGVKYHLEGMVEERGAKLAKATIESLGVTQTVDSLDKVPEAFRPMVERLLKGVNRGAIEGARPPARRD